MNYKKSITSIMRVSLMTVTIGIAFSNFASATTSVIGEVAGRLEKSAHGDFNGDGKEDLAVCDANYSAGFSNGTVRIYTNPIVSLLTAPADATIQLIGDYNDLAGYSCATIDANGDGIDDLAIGAPSVVAADPGAIYLVLGSTSLASMSLTDPSVIVYSGVPIFGEDEGAGESVANAGDVDGDGYEDLLIGAYYRSILLPGDQIGAALLIYGSASPTSMVLDDPSIVEFHGQNTSDEAGKVVAGAGDVNGDGYSDFLVSSRDNAAMGAGGTDAGIAYLVLGSNVRLTSMSLGDPTILKYSGETSGDFASSALAAAGDVNADGYDDFLVGASAKSIRGASETGAAYLIFGSSTPTSVSLSDPSVVRYTGGNTRDLAGFSLSTAGDVNRDGYDDFLIGEPGADIGNTDAGCAYLILGKSSSAGMGGTLRARANLRQYVGKAAGDGLGELVSDFIVTPTSTYFTLSAPENDDGGVAAGQIWITDSLPNRASGFSLTLP